jgi:hypothetical protein
MFITNKELPQEVNFFDSVDLFWDEIQNQGKFSKGSWAFKPDHVPAGTPPIIIDDPLDISTHQTNAFGVWWDFVEDLWPLNMDNVQFSSNLNPQGTLVPGGLGGMAYLKPGWHEHIHNNALTSFLELGSFDIISGPPAGDNHTAMALELVSWDLNGVDDQVDMHITVFDKNEEVIGTHVVSGIQPFGKPFLGIVTKDPAITIGRVDIWDEWCRYEGISFIELFYQKPPARVNFFRDLTSFWEAIDEAGKIDKFAWDFKPHNESPNTPQINDFLDIFSHGTNPGDPWTGDAGEDLWPPFVDNVQFVSNATPKQDLNPAGGLMFLTPENTSGMTNNALVEIMGDASFDIISGEPAGANHTAFALELFAIGGDLPTVITVTVYDKTEQVMGQVDVDYFGDKAFIGILTKDPAETIGRIDVWDPSMGHEGVSYIQAFWQLGSAADAPQLLARPAP